MDSGEENLAAHAAEMARQHSYVEVPLPEPLPETGDIKNDVAANFALSTELLNQLVEHGTLADSRLETLLQISHNLGGGLTPEGKQKWLFWRLEEDSSGGIDEILQTALQDSMRLKDSPAT